MIYSMSIPTPAIRQKVHKSKPINGGAMLHITYPIIKAIMAPIFNALALKKSHFINEIIKESNRWA